MQFPNKSFKNFKITKESDLNKQVLTESQEDIINKPPSLNSKQFYSDDFKSTNLQDFSKLKYRKLKDKGWDDINKTPLKRTRKKMNKRIVKEDCYSAFRKHFLLKKKSHLKNVVGKQRSKSKSSNSIVKYNRSKNDPNRALLLHDNKPEDTMNISSPYQSLFEKPSKSQLLIKRSISEKYLTETSTAVAISIDDIESDERVKRVYSSLETKTQDKHLEHRGETQDDLVCKICYRFIVKSVVTKCGHSFCEKCLYDYLLFFFECPSCNLKLR